MEPNGSQLDAYLETGTGDRGGTTSEFYAWLQELYSRHYQYVVVTTRRASNLVEAIRKKYPDALPDYMTENGLLLLAETAAESYRETGSFPATAVVDDILVYGRNMNLLLTQFWIAIRQCLAKLGIDAEAEAEAAFFESIHLWIYAVNEAPILLRHEFQLTMHSQKLLSESKWRILSDSIARRIAVEDVANTSYVISVKLPYSPKRYEPDPAAWISERGMSYRDNRQEYRFYLFSRAAKGGIYPSVRSYKKQGFLYFTPYFFMPEVKWGQMINLLQTVFQISAGEELSATNGCIRLFNRIKECTPRMAVYAQLATLLLSQITLRVFLDQLSPKLEAKLVYDTDKIVRNFGPCGELKATLDGFCRIKWTESHLIKLLDCLEASGVPEDFFDAPPEREAGREEIEHTVERLVYRQAVDHERDAAGRLHHNPDNAPVNPLVNRTGEQELSQLLTRVKSETGNTAHASSMLPILSSLTQMMDLGDISLKARCKRRDGEPVFYSSVRTTEMSLAIMPRKLSAYYRQFYLLARLYYQEPDFPQRVEHYFRDVIFSGDPERRNTVMISDAHYFAQLIADNRMIVSSMLNWKVTPETE